MPSSPSPLINPHRILNVNKASLTLLAFHLRRTITDPPHQEDSNAHYLFETLTQKAQTTLPFPPLANLNTSLTFTSPDHLWLSDGPIDLGTITQSHIPLKATLSPFWIAEDTYVIDLTLQPQPETQDLTPTQLPLLKPQDLLFTDTPPTFLGQILWLYAEISPNDSAETIAHECAVNITGDPNIQQIRSSPWNGQAWFEYEVILPKLTYRLLITFNLPLNALQEQYDWILQLFCCQQKLRFIRQQALDSGTQARKTYSDITAQVRDVKTSMLDLDRNFIPLSTQILTQFPQLSLETATHLSHLKTHLTALKTNRTNLQIILGKLESHIPPEWQQDLKSTELWHQQIQTELDYFQPAHDLLTQTIQTIRATTESIRTNHNIQTTRHFQVIAALASLITISTNVYTRWVDHPWQWPQSLFPDGYVLDPAAFTTITAGPLVLYYTGWLIRTSVMRRRRSFHGIGSPPALPNKGE